MKVSCVEVAFTFHIPDPAGNGWQQFVLRVGKLRRDLDWSFSISGGDGANDLLPVHLLEAIQDRLSWARAQVRPEDIREHDDDDGCVD